MKQIRKRFTYANAMSSIAVFLILGGATAVAAKKIGKNDLKANSVTTAKIKRNAVTASKVKKNAITTNKIRNEAVTGAKINESTLGTVPNAANAATAASANSLVGRIPFSVFMGSGTRDIATVGPFIIKAVCNINNAGTDEGELQLFTNVDGAAMDDNNGDEFTPFNASDSPAELYFNDETTGQQEIEIGEEPGLIAVAPDGTAIVTQNESIGFNIAGHPGECYFAGLVQKVG